MLWTSTAKGAGKLIDIKFALFQHPMECANFQFTVHGHYTTAIPTAHDYVAPPLTNRYKTQSRKSPNALVPTYMR